VLADNLIFLRNIKGLSQEQVAEVVGISRQSYSKWEQGETYPDIDKCDKLAKFYGVTLDSLVHQNDKIGNSKLAPAPVGKHLWGTVTIGGKGQIVIPKAARDTFGLNEGDRLVVLGDDAEGIALVKAEVFEQRMQEALNLSRQMTDE
jgi:AbrB family looped-hinge helix DNA binding protein